MAVGDNGMTYRVQIDEGVLRAIGTAAQVGGVQEGGDF